MVRLAAAARDLARLPRVAVHAVGDRADRHLVGVEAVPEAAEHAARHRAVQLRHPVGALGQAQAHVRHVEHVRVVLRAEREHAVGRHAGQQVRVEVVADHVDREAVDARGHRRVRGEHGARPHGRQRLVEREARARAQLADALQAQVARVALVGVEDLGLRVPGDRAVRADGAHAADADEDLLADALVLVAAVEPVGDAAQVGVVLLDVGVEHQQRHPPDRGLPDARLEHLPGGHRDLDEHLLARGPGRSVSGARFWPDEQLQRQPLRVEHRVGLQLPAVERQRLPEVPRPVQQPDADERQAEVRGRLEVVAREHPEAARVVGQHLRDAELHREVADRRGQRRVVLPLALVPARLREVLGEVVGELADRSRRSRRRRPARRAWPWGSPPVAAPDRGPPAPRLRGRAWRTGPASAGASSTAGWWPASAAARARAAAAPGR